MSFILDIVIAYYISKRNLLWKQSLWLGFKRGWWSTLVALAMFVVFMIRVSIDEESMGYFSGQFAIRGLVTAWAHPIVTPVLAIYLTHRRRKKGLYAAEIDKCANH